MNMKGKALLAGCIALWCWAARHGGGRYYQNRGSRGDVRPGGQYGDEEFTGAERAVADINAKGGIKEQ